MPRAHQTGPTLTLRELNRALLARQLLLQRVRLPIPRAVERLGALQAQWPPAPYVALWSRLDGFKIGRLERALEERSLVKATLMRGTLHIVSAADFPHYAVAATEARRRRWPAFERAIVRYWGTQNEGTRRIAAGWKGLGDHAALHAAVLRFARKPRTAAEIDEFFAEQTKLPVELAKHFIWGFIGSYGGLVCEAAGGLWKSRGTRELVSAGAWLGGRRSPRFEDAVVHAVRRHLAAFGPASVADISSWTHIRTPPIGEALRTLGGAVTRFSDEAGRTLYDLADSPRPHADTSAPVRFLAKWDSPLLAYSPAERVRILPEAYRRTVITKNGDVVPTVLVDGAVAARWDAREVDGRAVLSIAQLRRLSPGERAGIAEEGERLVRFIHAASKAHHVRFVRPEALPAWNLSIRP